MTDLKKKRYRLKERETDSPVERDGQLERNI